MSAEPPRASRFGVSHWNTRGPIAIALLPLAGLFLLVATIRRHLFRIGLLKRTRLPVPVVVVGNFTVGGTGKTPLVIALVEALREAGFRPGVVSRGYGGSAEGAEPVLPEGDPLRSGDEPVLIARRTGVPVFVGKRRAAAGQALLAAHPEVNVILCDDGLQHHALDRDVEIAVSDARGIGNGLPLPAGPLRECPRPVDARVINGGTVEKGAAGKAAGEESTTAMTLVLDRFHSLRDPSRAVTLAELAGLRLHAAAGIGSPDRFFAQLRSLGLSIVAHPFPDHHRFTAADLAFPDCDRVLITEKDAVKCAAFDRGDIVVAAVDARLDPALPELVIRKLRGRTTP